MFVFLIWKLSDIEKGYPIKLIFSNVDAFSAPLLFATIVRSLDSEFERSIKSIMFFVSDNWGIVFEETKLPISTISVSYTHLRAHET